jgi:predicted Fe-Mo cluster-binding NifX family protein
MNIAITVWGQRISPVFDAAQTLLVAEVVGNMIVDRKVAVFQAGRFEQFVQLLAEMEVRVLICGALCAGPAGILESRGVSVISFMTGEAEQVLQMYVRGEDLNPFTMPGCRWRGCCRTVRR